jgi:hypothetical protein
MQKQTRTTKNNTPYKEKLKREQVSVLETQTQTIVEKGTSILAPSFHHSLVS